MPEQVDSDSATPTDARKRLRDIIRRESFRSGESFKLASGRQSSFFFDMKKTMCDPEGISLIARLVLDALKDDDVTHVGGLELGAVPIAIAVCQRSHGGKNLEAFIVRKAAKDHGTENLIDGRLSDGAEVALFEDVTTTGGSAMQAVRAVRARGCRVAKVVTVVDREEGARQAFADEGIELVALFTRSDFGG